MKKTALQKVEILRKNGWRQVCAFIGFKKTIYRFEKGNQEIVINSFSNGNNYTWLSVIE